MKKVILTSLILVLVVSLGTALATNDKTGNGAPSGYHYTLNIIGVKNAKTADMDDTKGHTIFVSMGGHNKIGLVESGTADAPGTEEGDFVVLDRNATDGDGALFALPAPGYDAYNTADPGSADTISDYSVFVRPLGKPGAWATITTCAELLDSDFAGLLSGSFVAVLNKAGYFGGYASVEQVGQDILTREKGKSTFTNVTAQLTSIVFKVSVDTDGDGVADAIDYIRVPIFSDIIQGEYWDYDDTGNLKLCQLRFYPGYETDVTESDKDPGEWNNE
jgi:hypothetical protein